jgi:hypothetical protein
MTLHSLRKNITICHERVLKTAKQGFGWHSGELKTEEIRKKKGNIPGQAVEIRGSVEKQGKLSYHIRWSRFGGVLKTCQEAWRVLPYESLRTTVDRQ